MFSGKESSVSKQNNNLIPNIKNKVLCKCYVAVLLKEKVFKKIIKN